MKRRSKKEAANFHLPEGFGPWTIEQQLAYRLTASLRSAFYWGARWAQAHAGLMPPRGESRAMTLLEMKTLPDPLGWAADECVRDLLLYQGEPYYGLSALTVDQYAPASPVEPAE